MSAEREILIEGRGIAGHNLAANLADGGWNVVLSGKEFKTPRSWFVLSEHLPQEIQRDISHGEIPSYSLDACRFIIVDSKTGSVKYDFSSKTSGEIDGSKYVMIDDASTKDYFKKRALSRSSVFEVSSNVINVRKEGNNQVVRFENGEVHYFNKVVDASGSSSNLLRKLESQPLKDDALAFWIYGYRVKGKFDPKTMYFL